MLYSRFSTGATRHVQTDREFMGSLQTDIEGQSKRKPVSNPHILVTTNDDGSELNAKSAIIYEHYFSKYSDKSIAGKLGIPLRVVNSVIKADIKKLNVESKCTTSSISINLISEVQKLSIK